MRFLVDLNMSPITVSLFNDMGHDAIAVKDVMPPSSPDTDIVAKAVEENRVVVTMDSDIPSLIAESHSAEPSVIFIRISNQPVEVVNRALTRALPDIYDDLSFGAIVVIGLVRQRIRRLPIL